MTLGQIIKSYRNEKGLSQPEFSEQIGIEQSYLSKLENDKSIPSNDTIKALLRVLGVSLQQLLEQVESLQEQQRLQQIPLVSEYYQQQKQHKLISLRRYLYVSSLLIALGICCFYAGYTKKLFNDRTYEYQSLGVNLAGEPDDIFRIWAKLVESSDYDEKRKQMNQRYDPKTIDSFDFKGESFVVSEGEGKRYFWIDGRREVPRPINIWLEIFGVFLFVSGVMGFVLVVHPKTNLHSSSLAVS